MFGTSPEKRITREAEKIAALKEDLDAQSWSRVLEIGQLLQGPLTDAERTDLSHELTAIAQANVSLAHRLGLSEAAAARIMPSGLAAALDPATAGGGAAPAAETGQQSDDAGETPLRSAAARIAASLDACAPTVLVATQVVAEEDAPSDDAGAAEGAEAADAADVQDGSGTTEVPIAKFIDAPKVLVGTASAAYTMEDDLDEFLTELDNEADDVEDEIDFEDEVFAFDFESYEADQADASAPEDEEAPEPEPVADLEPEPVPEPEPQPEPDPEPEPAPEPQSASDDADEDPKKKEAYSRHRFARFRNLYENDRSGLCLFEDEHGHLIAVDSSKLI